ncbi:uncharacterized mitochondrial protein AtMg00820-like [Telopea speciosissima]|uniref:uncharacterized mitochondrial protein AtMg00820-like n=1 Tax=Telopea speciosissima TaxID=54955 RepID=UPI001CC7857E|nr:uncharacterized mitochondrial protein AtMg00820-like [Telopea speciosissima]
MVTRLRGGVTKPVTKLNLLATRHPIPQALLATIKDKEEEPTSYTLASKDPKWRAAMNDEFDALMRNGTWKLIPPNPSLNIVGNKWVFRIKRNADGSISRYRA